MLPPTRKTRIATANREFKGMRCCWYASVVRVAVSSLTAFALCSCFLTLNGVGFSAYAQSERIQTQVKKALRNGEYLFAEQLLREFLRQDATNLDAKLALAFVMLKQRRFAEAYQNAVEAINVAPNSAYAHAVCGSAILNSGDFRGSIASFRRSIALDERASLAVAGLAIVDLYENRIDSAVRGLRRAVDLSPSEPDFLFYLGQAEARNEAFKEAANAYERFLEIAPKTDSDRRARIKGMIDFLRYLGKQGSLYAVAGKDATEITFDSADNRPVLKVRINGSKSPLRFVLDTGSGMSVISEETARQLDLHPISKGGLARAVGGGGKFEIVYGLLSSLELGDVRIERVPVYIRRFYDQSNSVDGYIGLSLLSKFVASIDYGTRTFKLARPRRSPLPDTSLIYQANLDNGLSETLPTGAIEIPLRTTSSGFLSGEVYLEGVEKPQNFIIDTAATVSVISEELAADDQLSRYLQPSRIRVFGAAGIAEDVQTIRLPRIAMGTFSRQDVSAAIMDLRPVNETAGFTQNGILGANFLRHFRVSFDFGRGMIRLEPSNAEALNQTKRKDM